MDLKGATFVISKNQACAPMRKEKLSQTSKARREASRNEFVEKGGVSDKIESFGEVDNRKDCPRSRPGFVKPIQIGLRKKQNLIKSRLPRVEIGLAGREWSYRLQKEE